MNKSNKKRGKRKQREDEGKQETKNQNTNEGNRGKKIGKQSRPWMCLQSINKEVLLE